MEGTFYCLDIVSDVDIYEHLDGWKKVTTEE
jgi:hypothetical protein